MLKKVLYTCVIKSVLILEKIKLRLAPKIVNPTPLIQQSGEFFVREHNGKLLFSPSFNCLNALYDPIFKHEIYGFRTDSKTPLIIDCGSNIGLGIIYWKSIYPNASVIAFEPSKKVFEALEKNIKEHDLQNVTAINAALSNFEGTQEFTYNEDVSGSLFLEKDLGNTYNVKTVLLEKYLEEKVDFLKVDIEGEEINIFPQIVKNLNNIENLFIEYHSFVNHKQQLSMFFHELEKNGFRYYLEGEYKSKGPLLYDHTHLNQDLQVSIWAKKMSKD
ncbi:MAG: FkbM family methyltransferase [Bacteroidota bacterium]|nr:FkbM family methyltransferase [Bacteroidota bacterium]